MTRLARLRDWEIRSVGRVVRFDIARLTDSLFSMNLRWPDPKPASVFPLNSLSATMTRRLSRIRRILTNMAAFVDLCFGLDPQQSRLRSEKNLRRMSGNIPDEKIAERPQYTGKDVVSATRSTHDPAR